MEINDILAQELEFLKVMVNFKNSLSKSTFGEFLVDLKIYKEDGKWYFELRDAVNTSNDRDLLLHGIYKLDSEEKVFNLYNRVIDFHLKYAKQSNVIIWCWNEISVPPDIFDKKIKIKLSLNPVEREILELALSKIKSIPNHMSMNLFDNSPVNYLMNDDYIVNQYRDLLYKYNNNFNNDIQIINYDEIYKEKDKENVIEETHRISIEINDLLTKDGLYISGMEDMI